ncbi:chorismate synthase [Sellimonas sp.]|uniref:chorismate synthase n=1 Tax=Sellimonas sp. TaxID=2021466 RepID=UPI000B3693D8|nr:chorismate synthase [Sellimonas sp.]OUP02829.1 chorismate synthase [Drancourtella sp. An210]
MAGSSFGKEFQISTWGESHGPGIGVVIDGCPSGLSLCASDIQKYLNRRKPGQNAYTTARKEADEAEILSGVFEGRTTGTPISILVRNTDQRSHDYSQIKECYRPGHADYTFDVKYGFRDYRGGGRSSGRETIGRVAGGAVASALLKELGITVTAYTKAIGPYEIPTEEYDLSVISSSPLFMPHLGYSKKAEAYLKECMEKKDSAGGIIECIIEGMPAGIGEPVFQKLDALLAHAMLSIGSVKGFEIGSGFSASRSKGSLNNDAFCMDEGKIVKKTNHAGGVLGGMSDGSPVLFRVAIKPTPSISSMQHTVTSGLEDTQISIHGRHDPVIVPRAVVVVESMAAVTVADLLLQNMHSSMDGVRRFYL